MIVIKHPNPIRTATHQYSTQKLATVPTVAEASLSSTVSLRSVVSGISPSQPLVIKGGVFGGKQKRKHEDRKNVKWQRQESRANNQANRAYTMSKKRYYDRRK